MSIDHRRFLLAGVMGHPVMHSRSPMLHNYWLEKHGLIGRYLPLEIEPHRIAPALRALPALGFSGCNLTIPLKVAALPLMNRVAPLASRIGAVNCVVVTADGELEGYNFDDFGFTEALAQELPELRPDAGAIVVIGAGGGARAVVEGLSDLGAKEIRVLNRTPARANKLAEDLGSAVVALPWESRNDALEDAILLVNATSQGMDGEPALEIDLEKLPLAAAVFDIVYIPRETPLIAAARARGHRAVNGLGMLIHQARPAFEKWFGVMPEVTAELRARIEATIPAL